MEDDIPEDTMSVRSDLKFVLSTLAMFETMSLPALAAIAAEIEWMSIPGGSTLFELGEQADAMYVVLSGCLGTFGPGRRGETRFIARIVAGESVGEMSLIAGRARNATVIALRDTEVGRLSREAFDRIVASHPDALLRIARLTVQRLEAANDGQRARSPGPRTFTVVPQSIDIDIADFVIKLVHCLRVLGRTELVWNVRGADHTSHWFSKVESNNDFVVYVADQTQTPWTKLCIRQADILLLLARSEREPGAWPALADTREVRMALQRAELVLLHGGEILPGAVTRWQLQQPGAPHHHVRGEADIARLSRLITNTATGIVMSGGGARGFAHIGVVKALREHGIPIDLVGGSSIGAIMGAAVAAGWSVEEMIERFHRTFVVSNPLGDYTLPIVSLVSGRRVSHRLRKEFGRLLIEDMPLPYFCVSANLTTGHAAVHRAGKVWHWTRASVAIPGVLPPVVDKGEVFVDGGTINNLPVDVMRDMARGAIIACDAGAEASFRANSNAVDIPQWWRADKWPQTWRRRPKLIHVLLRAGMVNSAITSNMHRAQSDLLLTPPLAQIDMMRWKSFDAAIEAGYRHTLEQLELLPDDIARRLHVPLRNAAAALP